MKFFYFFAFIEKRINMMIDVELAALFMTLNFKCIPLYHQTQIDIYYIMM